MKRPKNLFVLVLFFFAISSFAQEPLDRIKEIKEKLNTLADSISPGLNQTADLSFANISLQNFLRTIAESHSLNIQVDPTLELKVTTNFTSVLVKDVLVFLCESQNLNIRFLSNILYVSKYIPPVVEKKRQTMRELRIEYFKDKDVLSADLQMDTLSSVIRKITKLSGKNVIASSDKLLSRLVNGFIQNASFESALDKIAFANSMSLQRTPDGFYIFNEAADFNLGPSAKTQNRNSSLSNDGRIEMTLKSELLFVEATNVPIADIIKLASDKLKIEFILSGNIAGNTSLNVQGLNFDQLLGYLFRTTTYTFRKNGEVYVIGERIQEGLRKVEVIRMEFRTVEGIEKEIPTELAKGVEIKVFKDLNSLILSGSTPVIEEIKKFLIELDKPVPNILIELTVIDLKKGFTIQTGIQAFLADSVPKTKGQVFPKVDLTLSSASINNALSSLTNNGIINLGKVSPNFYVNLKALEDNSNIDIRSTPRLSTMNGHEASLTIGRSQYYVETTQNITGGVAPITSTGQRFNKVEANLSIIIKPIVSGNEHITLDFEAEFSDFVPATVQNAPPGNSTRKFKSKIRVKNEETLLFGGLEQESRSQSSSGVPILSRIPVLKWLFSSRSKSKQRDQLIILIKPTVVY